MHDTAHHSLLCSVALTRGMALWGGAGGEYLVLAKLIRQPAGAVKLQQRVAAFLQPTDGAYLDALGKPVALFDYTYVLSRMED